MSQLAVRAANLAFYDAFTQLDLDAMSKLWAKRAPVTCVHPGWDLVLGYEAVMQSWRAIFEGTSEIRFRVEDPQVTAVGEAGWVVCRELLYTTVGGTPLENAMTAINTFVLEDGVFRITHHHAAPLISGKPRSVRPPDTQLH